MSTKLRQRADELLGKERGTVFKDPGGRLSVCLIYPNTYHVGMSNLGFQGLYTMLNEREDVVCERAFMPDAGELQEYHRTGTELFALESKRPVGRFDILAFSVSFENDYPHVVDILRMGRIPVLAGERREGHPLVIMGGACAISNPEPLAPFLDVCFIGEAEEMVEPFVDLCGRTPDRAELLRESASIDGIYVPSFYDVSYAPDGTVGSRTSKVVAPPVIKRRFASDIAARPLKPSILTPETEFSDMYLLEAMRGCPHSCAFCMAGHVYNPPRKKPLDVVRAESEAAAKEGVRVGLIGPSLTDYPEAAEALSIEGVDFSITSLRARPRSAELVKLLKGKKSVSIAPEAGTERLRRVINKKITHEDIIETAGLILDAGIEKLRLYFMVGLPTEENEDIEGIIALVRQIRELSPRGKLSITLSTFVPKPWTPFQWHPMDTMQSIKKKIAYIKKYLGAVKGVRVLHDVPKYAFLQGMLARGDRRLAGALLAMSSQGDWDRAARAAGINPDFYTLRERGKDETFPWDFIDMGLEKSELWARYERLLGLQ